MFIDELPEDIIRLITSKLDITDVVPFRLTNKAINNNVSKYINENITNDNDILIFIHNDKCIIKHNESIIRIKNGKYHGHTKVIDKNGIAYMNYCNGRLITSISVGSQYVSFKNHFMEHMYSFDSEFDIKKVIKHIPTIAIKHKIVLQLVCYIQSIIYPNKSNKVTYSTSKYPINMEGGYLTCVYGLSSLYTDLYKKYKR
jgi:hypothetical protein